MEATLVFYGDLGMYCHYVGGMMRARRFKLAARTSSRALGAATAEDVRTRCSVGTPLARTVIWCRCGSGPARSRF